MNQRKLKACVIVNGTTAVPAIYTSATDCLLQVASLLLCTVKILKFGTPQTFAITVLKIEKFDVTLH